MGDGEGIYSLSSHKETANSFTLLAVLLKGNQLINTEVVYFLF